MADRTGSIVLTLDGVEMTAALPPKDFASGSDGFFLQGKGGPLDAERPGGKGAGPRYQVQVTVTRIGSKDE